MSTSEYQYKIIELTQPLVGPDNGTNILSVQSKAGWDVQQVFSRLVASDTERVFALLRQKHT